MNILLQIFHASVCKWNQQITDIYAYDNVTINNHIKQTVVCNAKCEVFAQQTTDTQEHIVIAAQKQALTYNAHLRIHRINFCYRIIILKYSAFLWRYEPVRRTGKSDDCLTIFFSHNKVHCSEIPIVLSNLSYHYFFHWIMAHFNFVITKMPNGGMPVSTLIATGWRYRKIFFYKKALLKYLKYLAVFKNCHISIQHWRL